MMNAVDVEQSVEVDATQFNAALIRRFYDEIFVGGNLDAAEDIVADNFVDHLPMIMPMQPTKGPDAVKWFARQFRDALPDVRVTIDDMLAVDNTVVARVRWTGCQSGQLFGAEPTGKHLSFTGIDVARIHDGKIVEHWGLVDVLTIFTQLGFMPE